MISLLKYFRKKTDPITKRTDGMPQKKESLETLWRLVQVMLNNLEFGDVAGKVVNQILNELGYLQLGYRIIVLALLNEGEGVLERVAISSTEEAQKAIKLSPVPFKDIRIPIYETENLGIKAMREKSIYKTRNWYDILQPVYSQEQAAIVQQAVGIKSSMIYPISFRGKPIGVLIFSMVKEYEEVTEEESDLLDGFTDLVGLAIRNSILFTSLRNTTAQLTQANIKLEQLDKLKDDFVSIASHELRTPMTAIKSYAWMALHRSDIPLSKTLEKYITRIFSSTERLINLVNDMLNVSRIESGSIEINPEPVDLIALVKDIVDEVRYSKSAEKKLNFVVRDRTVPEVFADPGKLRQVLLNLVGNSLKFTPPGGQIIFDFLSDGRVVEIAVSDTGVGISKEDISKLFHKFGRLDNSYTAAATSGGTGLGLYISKSLVELMHGRIWAQSAGLNKGATFIISLPVATESLIQNASGYRVKPAGVAKELEPVVI